MKSNLSIIGLGTRSVNQLTLEALTILKKCDVCLILPITSEETELKLQELGIKNLVNLKYLYSSGHKDTDNYQKILSEIVSYTGKYSEVALLIPGHPRIGVTLVQWLEKLNGKVISLTVLPGISSFSAMINDLKIDPIEMGSSILDANRILLFEYEIEPTINHFIYHVCSVGTSNVHVDSPYLENRLDLLKTYLLKFYDENHQVALVCSGVSANDPSDIKWSSIKDMNQFLEFVHFGTTLYVPGAKPKKINKNYYKLLTSSEKSCSL